MIEETLVVPAAGQHAIEVMALAVEWGKPIGAEVFGEISSVYERSDVLRAFLPRVEQIQGVSLHFSDQGPAFSAGQPQGVQWSQHKDDGSPNWVVHIRSDLLSVSCMAYDRWNTIKPQALEVLSPIVDLVTTLGYPMQAVGLQYQDAFRVQTPSVKHATETLLLAESPWLSPRIWREEGPWHAHQGWFSSGLGGRLVHNLLNVDAVVEAAECVFRINGQHRMLVLGAKGQGSLPLMPADVSSSLENLHTVNKRVLVDLLAEAVRTQIGLYVSEDS